MEVHIKKILGGIWNLPANFADTIESGQQLHIARHGDLLFLSNLIIWSHIMTDLVHTHSAAQTQRIPRRKHMR